MRSSDAPSSWGVRIPDSVTSMGVAAFEYCTNLSGINLPAKLASIGISAFEFCRSLTNVTIPSGTTNIGMRAFYSTTNLTAVYFRGNAPNFGSNVFYGNNRVIIYYLPGTADWGATFGGRPTALWKPQVQTNDGSFGVRSNQFGFTINWSSGRTVVVESCTNLSNPQWSPMSTNSISTDGTAQFGDRNWTNYPARFYRVRWP
jgi:BspA type Leucine rich repeat region (6 copies)